MAVHYHLIFLEPGGVALWIESSPRLLSPTSRASDASASSGIPTPSLSLYLLLPPQPHLPITVATMPFPLWLMKPNFCFLSHLSVPPSRRGVLKRKNNTCPLLWGRGAMSSPTVTHRFRGHHQAGPGEIGLENLSLLPSSQKDDLQQVFSVMDKRRKWWPDDTGSTGVLVLTSPS